ncbi:MAG: arginine deiminase-related protein [Rhodospirillales bacterium]
MAERRSAQAPAGVVMIRPRHFRPNAETAADNRFQSAAPAGDEAGLGKAAYDEVTDAAARLEAQGLRVHLFEDEAEDRPDAVFPNNWFSTHSGGHVAIYPLYAASRRRERRQDVIETLKRLYRVQDVIDYSGLEPDGLFLEGTGAMVLDHIDRVAYAVRSKRTDPVALERFCTHFNYEPLVFDATDAQRTAIYHTNVLLCIATDFVMIGLDSIVERPRRREIVARFEESGREVMALTGDQIANFAGNAMELQGAEGRILALSTRALHSLRPDQLAVIEKSATPLDLAIPTIELAGGSVRCMLAGIHLSPR